MLTVAAVADEIVDVVFEIDRVFVVTANVVGLDVVATTNEWLLFTIIL